MRSKLATPTQNNTLEPLPDNLIRLLRRMPQRPMTARHLSTRQIRNLVFHACAHGRNEHAVVFGLDEEDGLSVLLSAGSKRGRGGRQAST